jgi:hypothetical protein
MSSETTVISAFYPLLISNPKYSIGQYKVWLQNLCKIPCYLIIFTTQTFALEIYQWRRLFLDKTHVIVRPFESFAMTCPSMIRFWKKQEELDEEHFGTSELYAMWSLKQELVRIAINQNRFKSKWFCWCDVGIQRFSKLQAHYMTFPHDIERLCLPGRMTFLEVDKIPQSYLDDWNEDKPVKYPFPEITLGSGCIVGDTDAWTEFGDAYKEMLKEFAIRGWFAGKETSVFFAILMEKKTKTFRLFYAKQFVNIPGIEWLSFPVMLGGNLDAEVDTRFEPLDSR